jgi:hypothetical protein
MSGGVTQIRGRLPLRVRKEMLKDVLKDSTRVRYTQHVGEGGVRLYEMAAELGIEGILAKRADSPYRRGRTSDGVSASLRRRGSNSERRTPRMRKVPRREVLPATYS